ncbi:MAG: hypothetical protein ACHQAY_05340 [Hyphomicrobiales bacterium]
MNPNDALGTGDLVGYVLSHPESLARDELGRDFTYHIRVYAVRIESQYAAIQPLFDFYRLSDGITYLAGERAELPLGEAQALLGGLAGEPAATFIEYLDPPAPPTPADLRNIVGMVGSTPIIVSSGASLGPAGTVKVTLSADYVELDPPGWPTRPYAGQPVSCPRTVSNGSTIELLRPEADALVAAGAASYA